MKADRALERLMKIDYTRYHFLKDLDGAKKESIDLVTNYWDFKSKVPITVEDIEAHTSVQKLGNHMWNAVQNGLKIKNNYT
jgi:hypothetical protein